MSGVAPEAGADDFRSHQWYLDSLRMPEIWKVSKGRGVTVAVLDSGISEVPELRGRVLPGKEVSNAPTGSMRDKDNHGTNMAALIAGTGAGGGIQGIAPEAKILPVKAVTHPPEDSVDGVVSRGIRYAVSRGAKIINISLGAEGEEFYYRKTQKAVNEALAKGSLVFASVGNGGKKGNPVVYPAALPGVVGVSAVDRSLKVASYSGNGEQVALAAPGDDIPWRCPELTGRCNSGGTSQATAIASGSAALIWAKHPNWTNHQVLRVMMQTAGTPDGIVPSRYIGYGNVRPRLPLLEGKGNPGPPDVNPLLAREGATEPNPSVGASPSPSAEAKEKASKSAKPAEAPSGDKAEAKSGSGGDGEGSGLWIGVGAGAATLAAVVGGVLFVRRRGRAL
ncbi:S8 family serine peptidase [Streptomyces palmae]|nr:S8 family serine peptidase [Streptomyces palmae]